MHAILVRREMPRDRAAVRDVNERAFGQPDEANLVEALHAAGVATIALVAEVANAVVGHILFSPVEVEGGAGVRLVGLAPMAVLPTHQRRGIGSELVRVGLRECEAAGYAAVVVLGHPGFYPRFGFRPAHLFGIRCEYDAAPEAFMARESFPGVLTDVAGLVRYNRAFAPEAVVLVPYDERWPLMFHALRDVYARALGDVALAIEHVGSTSVPGLLAKPVIDIDIVIASEADLPRVVRALSGLGYRHNGCQGVPGREVFKRDHQWDVPRDGSGTHWPAHHLYACALDCKEIERHLTFRDWLRSHPASAAEYVALKQRLAQVYAHDRDLYAEAKTEFVEAILAQAIASRRR